MTEFEIIIKKMTAERGNSIFFDPKKFKPLLLDYTKNEYKQECSLLLAIIEAGCVKFINEAKNLTECKQSILKRLEDEYSLSPSKSAPMLDLLFFILRGENTQNNNESLNDSTNNSMHQYEKKISCENCGKELQEEWKACPYCSTPVANVFCKNNNCKKELQKEWKICPFCLTPVTSVCKESGSVFYSGSGGKGYGISLIQPTFSVVSSGSGDRSYGISLIEPVVSVISSGDSDGVKPAFINCTVKPEIVAAIMASVKEYQKGCKDLSHEEERHEEFGVSRMNFFRYISNLFFKNAKRFSR